MILLERGDLICTPSINTPISSVGVSCLEDKNKFCDKGNFLKTLSRSNFLFACFSKTKVCPPVLPIPICTVLADPIWFGDWYNATFVCVWFAGGWIGST